MRREYRYKLTSAVSTSLIVAVLYTALNFNFLSFKSVAPVKTEEEEIEFPLDQIIEELSEIAPAADQKSQTQAAESKTEQSANNQSEEEKENLLTEKEPTEEVIQTPEKIIPLQPLSIKPIEIKTTNVDTVIPMELIKIIQEQNLANAQNKSNNKYKNQSPSDRYLYYQKNYKAIRNFLVVYPYAIKTREIIDSLNAKLALTSNKSEQKRMINETEKLLFKQYESAIRKMTTTQGRILLKLIARETNKSGYQIIKDFKGGFSATFWYAVGKLFRTDLKTEYHKENEDSIYEDIIYRHESGEF